MIGGKTAEASFLLVVCERDQNVVHEDLFAVKAAVRRFNAGLRGTSVIGVFPLARRLYPDVRRRINSLASLDCSDCVAPIWHIKLAERKCRRGSVPGTA